MPVRTRAYQQHVDRDYPRLPEIARDYPDLCLAAACRPRGRRLFTARGVKRRRSQQQQHVERRDGAAEWF